MAVPKKLMGREAPGKDEEKAWLLDYTATDRSREGIFTLCQGTRKPFVSFK